MWLSLRDTWTHRKTRSFGSLGFCCYDNLKYPNQKLFHFSSSQSHTDTRSCCFKTTILLSYFEFWTPSLNVLFQQSPAGLHALICLSLAVKVFVRSVWIKVSEQHVSVWIHRFQPQVNPPCKANLERSDQADLSLSPPLWTLQLSVLEWWRSFSPNETGTWEYYSNELKIC